MRTAASTNSSGDSRDDTTISVSSTFLWFIHADDRWRGGTFNEQAGQEIYGTTYWAGSKTMKTALVALLLLASLNCFGAETNGHVLITTNLIRASESFRVVNGQVYNTDLSKLWVEMEVEPINNRTNGIVATRLVPQYVSGGGSASYGNFLGGGPSKIFVGYDRKNDVFIYNAGQLPEGKRATIKAMNVGIVKIGGRTLEAWDAGVVNSAIVIKTNRVRVSTAAAKSDTESDTTNAEKPD